MPIPRPDRGADAPGRYRKCALLIARYRDVALDDMALAESPQSLCRERGFAPIVAVLIVAVTILSIVDIPVLGRLNQSRIIAIDLWP